MTWVAGRPWRGSTALTAGCESFLRQTSRLPGINLALKVHLAWFCEMPVPSAPNPNPNPRMGRTSATRSGATVITIILLSNRRMYRAVNEKRLQTLGELSLQLEAYVPFILQYGVMPSSTQLLEAGRPDLVQAIKVRPSLGPSMAVLHSRRLPSNCFSFVLAGNSAMTGGQSLPIEAGECLYSLCILTWTPLCGRSVILCIRRILLTVLAALQRMGGYRRVAAALELEYLHPRRGRGSSAPWSLTSTGSDLALVQFSQSCGPRPGAQRSSSSDGGLWREEPVMPSHRVQLQRLTDLQAALPAGAGRSRRTRDQLRRTDHDREERLTGECVSTTSKRCLAHLSLAGCVR